LTTKISIPAPWKAIARASGRVAVVHAALDVRAQASLLALALARRGDVVLVGPGRDRAVALARRWLPRARGGRSGRVRVVRAGGCVLWLAESPEDLDDLAADSLAGLFAHGCNGLGENPAVRAGAADAGLVVLAGQAPTRGHWFAHAANGEDGYDVVRIPWRAAVGAFPDQAEKVGDLEDRRNRRLMELEGAEPPPLALVSAARRRLWIRTDKPARLLSAGQRASAALAGGASWEASGAPPIVPAELLPMQRRYVAMKRLGRARGFTRFIVPKYRRGGITSIEQIESYLVAADRPNSWVLSLADTDRKARNIFPTVKLFHDRDPDAPPLIGAGSESRMRFANGSYFSVGTASGSATARGETYQRVHGSEVPYWCPGQRNAEEMDSVMAAITRAASNGEVSLEGTPNGREWFYHLFQDAKRGVVPWWPIFLRWFDDPLNVAAPGTYEPEEIQATLDAEEQDLVAQHGLTTAQIAWRRATKGELRRLFKQEYPEDDESCLDGGERVGTARGIIPIREVVSGDVLSTGRVVAVAEVGQRELVRVTTEMGFELRCTPDHRLARSLGGFARADESIGDHVKLSPPKFAEAEHVQRWTSFAGVRCELTIDMPFATFLGYFMGDGSFDGDTIDVCCCRKDQDVVEEVAGILRRFFEKSTVTYRRGASVVRARRRRAAEVFDQLGLLQDRKTRGRKRFVCVPECIFRSPRTHVVAFLSALFEADGWVSPTGGSVRWFSKDATFARDVQLLLLGLGIHAFHRRVKKIARNKTYFGSELYLNSRDALKFMREVGFRSARKRSRQRIELATRGRRAADHALIDRVTSVVPLEQPGIVYDLQMDGQPVFGGSGILVHNCFLTSGTCYFDVDKVMALARALRTYERKHVPGGYEVEWEAPEKGVEYVIGCDTSEGIPGCDPCGLGVLRRDTGAQVATAHGIFNPPTLAAHCVRVSRRYNDALVGIERQNHGHAVLQKVLELGLDRPHFHGGSLYYFKRGTDQMERGADGMAWTRHGRPGWSTDGESRPIMLQQLAAAIEDGSMKVRDADLLSEALSFRLQPSGKFEADSGAHDDTVFKWAIAWQMRKHRVVKPGIMVLEGSL